MAEADRAIAVNRKALHDFEILSSVEAGLVLTGTEIKSIRSGRINLRDAFARGEKSELWLYNCHIAPYEQGNRYNHEPTRPRKLLLHRSEIDKLGQETREKGLTLIPTRLYLKGGRIKVEIAVAKGKKFHDKREAIRAKEMQAEAKAAMARRTRQ